MVEVDYHQVQLHNYSYHNFKPNPLFFLDVENGAEYSDFEGLLAKSDFVIATCALTKETQHLFDKKAFESMKNSAVFINTSRGGIVNQEDLVEALQNQTISMAGLDVMTPEPLPTDHPLTK